MRMLKNTATQYGSVTKFLHWIMGGLVIFMLALGLFLDSVQDLLLKLSLYNLHKSLGILILVLVVLRLGWHVYSRKPEMLAGLKAWEKTAARLAHVGLYTIMIAMPLSGWLMSSAGGRPVQFFSLFTLPDFVGKDDHLRDLLGVVHGYIGYAAIVLVCVHAAAALKHHFIARDQTLRRMLPFICER